MTETERKRLEERVLILAPQGKDASLTAALLREAGINCVICSNIEDLVREIEARAGAVLLAEEALSYGEGCILEHALSRQPVWSDLPILILTRPGADSATAAQSVQAFGNVTLLERPIRMAALLSAVHTALRARERQYQIRSHIVELDQAEKTRAHLAAIVSSSDDAIISKTLDGIITSWNSSAERLFGYTPEEAIGRSITLIIPPERLDEETRILQALRQGQRIDHFETERVSKSGRKIDLSITVSPILDASGRVIGASKVARDITARKRSEEALRQADRRKDEFLAMLAHELRNPLAPICNSLHILRLTSRNDAATERVAEMMERQVTQMVRLVDDLLEVSRITRGKIELRKEPIELAAFVRNAVETSRPLIQANGHQLAIALPAEPVTLEGDAVRLTQVLTNLLNNAAKYTDPCGQIWLSARREGDHVIASVRDNGVGIAPDKLPLVFELFMQVDRTSSRAQGGLGFDYHLMKPADIGALEAVLSSLDKP
jgi:PAS domain S-box-containing protein